MTQFGQQPLNCRSICSFVLVHPEHNGNDGFQSPTQMAHAPKCYNQKNREGGTVNLVETCAINLRPVQETIQKKTCSGQRELITQGFILTSIGLKCVVIYLFPIPPFSLTLTMRVLHTFMTLWYFSKCCKNGHLFRGREVGYKYLINK